MNPSFRTDVEHSILKPAGPHLLERSSDAPTQTLSRAKVTILKPYTAAASVASPNPAPPLDSRSK
jgi:hypothetical protein